MAYVKQEWKDEVLNGAEKYKITRSDGTILAENVSVELITQILQAGTPITAERMNHIEDGIAGITPESIGAMAANAQSGNFNSITPAGNTLSISGDLSVTGNISQQTSIIPLTLKNGWIANAGWGDSNLRCVKVGRLVNLQGMVFNGSATSNVIGTIPANVTTIGRVIAPCLVNNDIYRPISILNNGEIHIGESNKDVSTVPWIWISAFWLTNN